MHVNNSAKVAVQKCYGVKPATKSSTETNTPTSHT